MKSCGSCTLCCTIMGVQMDPHPEPMKPIYTPCRHECKRGCGIYEIRPDACRTWECFWLATQGFAEMFGVEIALPKDMRPDRCGVVLEMNSMGNVIAHCKTGREFQKEPMRSFLRKLARKIQVLVGHHDSYQLLLPDGRLEDLVRLDTSEQGEIQYARKDELEAKIQMAKNAQRDAA